MTPGRSRFVLTAMAFGFAFLYAPLFVLIVYSFNESRLVTVWAGFSLKWWAELLRNESMLAAAWLSLKIAFATACGATVLGTMAGFVLARRRAFPGRTAFSAMIAAPLVMPEVILGVAMLLLFVAIEKILGGPERGAFTIVAAHVTFTMAFVAVIVQSRLAEFDRSLEEAALDLGATPARAFFLVTLPVISPAVIAGWLLAFSLSLDDLILTQFVAGPTSQTLPMLVYSSVRLGVSPQINVLATVMILAVACVVLCTGILLNRADRARLRKR